MRRPTPSTAPGDRAADPRAWFGPEDRPWVERDGWREDPAYRAASPERRAQADRFHHDGVVVLRGAVDRERCAEVVASLAPHLGGDTPARRTNAWWALEPVRRLALEPAVLDLIAFLYGRRPIPFQTLDFRVGTEQEAHRDDVHFDSLPPSYLCGAWVALEDVAVDQGPVAYHPGSQAGPPVGEDAGEAVPFTASAGDVLVWAAGVRHGGCAIDRPGATRWSQVTHYLFDDCTWYTPLHSDVAAGSLALRHPLVDVTTGRPVRPVLGGAPARFVHGPGRRSRVLHPDEPGPSSLDRLRGLRHRLVPQLSARLGPPAAWARRRPPRG